MEKVITVTIVILFICLILLAVLYLLRSFFFNGVPVSADKNKETKSDIKKKVPCILCGSVLLRGENLKSEEFKGKDESIVHIFGCRHCYGDAAIKIRRCPVCKKVMTDEGYLRSSMWKTKKGKIHVHVSGCTQCNPGRQKK